MADRPQPFDQAGPAAVVRQVTAAEMVQVVGEEHVVRPAILARLRHHQEAVRVQVVPQPAQEVGRPVSLMACEPCSETRVELVARLAAFSNVTVMSCAVSSADGYADFFSRGAGVGTNSLSAVSGPWSERVPVLTLGATTPIYGVPRTST